MVERWPVLRLVLRYYREVAGITAVGMSAGEGLQVKLNIATPSLYLDRIARHWAVILFLFTLSGKMVLSLT